MIVIDLYATDLIFFIFLSYVTLFINLLVRFGLVVSDYN